MKITKNDNQKLANLKSAIRHIHQKDAFFAEKRMQNGSVLQKRLNFQMQTIINNKLYE
jgi:hypothetical protein